ncbi:hypothetical protein J7I98_08050 [Streptomyces sp. ISL-98]|uniref:hypothetical protein n=1 Tax=Streptomyces sp. ISL-98 TaxID=2819192 RepID=UPI001BE53D99|nr:hypothetical protein [Streptomyces sp. ISL-98]MBT2505855.1 hypothetical protein [Streptomyces sp. ISL-98]
MLIGDSARVVREETMKGNGFVVAPVMRNLMTHTVAFARLVDGGETAIKALNAYSDEQILKLINNARAAGWDVGGDPVEAHVRNAINDRVTDDPAVERLKNEIRNTAQLMAAFDEQDAYLPFRHLVLSHHARDRAALPALSRVGCMGDPQPAQPERSEQHHLDSGVPDPFGQGHRLHPHRPAARRAAR